MIRSEVRITPHHLRTFATSQLLQSKQRCTVLHVPARPSVPNVVPPRIGDACTIQSSVLGFSADLCDRLTPETEHMRRMLPELLADNCESLSIQWHRNRTARFSLICTGPCEPPRQPFQRVPKAGAG